MANELLYSGAGDLTVAEVLLREVQFLLAERAFVGNHPALFYVGDLSGSGSTVIKQSQLGWAGTDILQDTAEDTAATEVAITDASATVTVARKALTRNISDLLTAVDSQGIISSPAGFALDAVGATQQKLMDMIVQLADGFTATAGPGTGVDLDLDSFLVANIVLDVANASTDRLSILHPQQVGDLQRDMATAATGAIAFDTSSLDFIAMRGTGFKGSVVGVPIFSSGRVPTVNAGADYGGSIFSRGAILWGDATHNTSMMAPGTYINAGKILIEFARGKTGSSKAVQQVVYNALLGASFGINAAGVTLESDA
ncbi:MAG: hypothetical protein GY913_15340 [Proteobacteria bacterium]|nr:hypothetical protein [Pseudomonadota bacterium]